MSYTEIVQPIIKSMSRNKPHKQTLADGGVLYITSRFQRLRKNGKLVGYFVKYEVRYPSYTKQYVARTDENLKIEIINKRHTVHHKKERVPCECCGR